MPNVNPRGKTMVPSGVQSMPMVSGFPTLTTAGEPPSTGTFFNLPSAMNAIHAPSGEKTGPAAPSVPARPFTSSWSILRTYRLDVPSLVPTYASVLPSLDSATFAVSEWWTRGTGRGMDKRVTTGDGMLARPSNHPDAAATTATSAETQLQRIRLFRDRGSGLRTVDGDGPLQPFRESSTIRAS